MFFNPYLIPNKNTESLSWVMPTEEQIDRFGREAVEAWDAHARRVRRAWADTYINRLAPSVSLFLAPYQDRDTFDEDWLACCTPYPREFAGFLRKGRNLLDGLTRILFLHVGRGWSEEMQNLCPLEYVLLDVEQHKGETFRRLRTVKRMYNGTGFLMVNDHPEWIATVPLFEAEGRIYYDERDAQERYLRLALALPMKSRLVEY